MSYAWKVLIPFALVQIFLNGAILVYDLPGEELWLAVGSWAAAAALVATVYYAVRVTPRTPLRMVPVTAKGAV
jgi:hypothetical protein